MKERGSGTTRKVAALLKLPSKEEGKKEKETEGMRKEVKEWKRGRGRKEREKGKWTEWVGILGKKKKVFQKEMNWLGLLPGAKIIFGP